MEAILLTGSGVLALTGGMELRARQSNEGRVGTMRGIDESKSAMVDQCPHVPSIQVNFERPPGPPRFYAFETTFKFVV